MTPIDRLRMKHMLRAAQGALRAIQGKSFQDLDVENDFTLALIKRLEIIGEAASRVRPETRQDISQIPWLDIVNTRHRLIHGYNEINLATVWQIATEELNPLVASLERILG